MILTLHKDSSRRIQWRMVLVHLLMYSAWHYAQFATLVRQHGFRADRAIDWIVIRLQLRFLKRGHLCV